MGKGLKPKVCKTCNHKEICIVRKEWKMFIKLYATTNVKQHMLLGDIGCKMYDPVARHSEPDQVSIRVDNPDVSNTDVIISFDMDEMTLPEAIKNVLGEVLTQDPSAVPVGITMNSDMEKVLSKQFGVMVPVKSVVIQCSNGATYSLPVIIDNTFGYGLFEIQYEGD